MEWRPTPVLLPGKSHGWRSLIGCRPWGREESDTTERLHFHFSLSCIGEGNGNPLQCLCLENPRDGGAWWAAVYGVPQSRTRLKWLSSSSSSRTWKQPKCPSAEEWIKKMWYIYTMEYYLAIKKNEVMALAATWIDLDIVILSEISQRKTNIIWYHLYVESKRKKRLKSTYFQNRDSHTENKIIVTKGREGIH